MEEKFREEKLRERLKSFYEVRVQHKIDRGEVSLDKLLEAIRSGQETERDIFRTLTEKYGPEPYFPWADRKVSTVESETPQKAKELESSRESLRFPSPAPMRRRRGHILQCLQVLMATPRSFFLLPSPTPTIFPASPTPGSVA